MSLKFLLIIALLVCNAVFAQKSNRFETALKEFNNDTIAYLQNKVLAHTDRYIGKPFDSLLNDLPPVVNFFNSLTPSTLVYPKTRLNFSSWGEIMGRIDQKEFALTIVITWTSSLTKAEAEDLNSRTKGIWNATTADFYRSRIVGSIDIIRYDGNHSFKL